MRLTWVVYLLIPTSNHNCTVVVLPTPPLYIFWFLHQTTTRFTLSIITRSCISFDSYIKPQHKLRMVAVFEVVYLLIPTSNHNLQLGWVGKRLVVYLLIPTSNHNPKALSANCGKVVYLLIPTSNHNYHVATVKEDDVVYLLIPTSNHNQWVERTAERHVVYLLIPTSNHNNVSPATDIQWLYIFWFLHQTTTWNPCGIYRAGLYIFWFLHQTTTWALRYNFPLSCISFDSYIKPQLPGWLQEYQDSCISFDSYIKPQQTVLGKINKESCISFDSYIKPQHDAVSLIFILVVYLLIPTSNHNYRKIYKYRQYVVYLLIPTSNHNSMVGKDWRRLLYIFWFLHQTTTTQRRVKTIESCISFDSYIKPQRRGL